MWQWGEDGIDIGVGDGNSGLILSFYCFLFFHYSNTSALLFRLLLL
jgi:hypothetical protein